MKSREGKGSEFFFTMMLNRATYEVPGQATMPDVENYAGILNGVSILIAEDHQPNSFLAKQFLTKWGAHVSIAENGAEALTKLAEQKFDIVLMDLQMPVMDGFECTTRIRKTHPDLPILALTAARSEEIDAKTVAAGMNDIVGKPFIPKELRAKILLHLKNNQMPKDGKRA